MDFLKTFHIYACFINGIVIFEKSKQTGLTPWPQEGSNFPNVTHPVCFRVSGPIGQAYLFS
jgi:hypothetical protein